MNKFHTRELKLLIDELRIEARRAENGEELGSVRPLEAILRDAADSLSSARDYYHAVEAALV